MTLMEFYLHIYIYIFSFILSFALVPVFKALAIKLGVLDKPGHRKIHNNAKPLLGGAAVFLSFNLTIILNIIAFNYMLKSGLITKFLPLSTVNIFNTLPKVAPSLLYLLIGGAVVFVIGILDDVLGEKFPIIIKPLGQVLAAVILLKSGVRINFMKIEMINYLVSLLWIVGISNSFNLLDNMDGLSSGVAIISSVIFLFLAIMQGQIFIVMALCCFIGAIMGFYPYNVYPSTIFLGDAGSLFIGYIAASLTIFQSYAVKTSSPILPVLIPLIILSVPLFDTFSVIIIRIKEKRPIYVGDKKHLSHRLVDLGMTHRQAVGFIYLTTFALGITALLLPYLATWGGILIILQAIAIISLISLLMFFGSKNGKK